MAEKRIDARGLSCPEPVLLSKRAIEGLESGMIEVLVDTVTSRENITRMARHLGCDVQTKVAEDDGFVLCIRKE